MIKVRPTYSCFLFYTFFKEDQIIISTYIIGWETKVGFFFLRVVKKNLNFLTSTEGKTNNV